MSLTDGSRWVVFKSNEGPSWDDSLWDDFKIIDDPSKVRLPSMKTVQPIQSQTPA